MKKLQLNKKNKQSLKKESPLIQKEELISKSDQLIAGEWVEFISTEGNYLGTGYLGKQNKGIGWIISRQQGQLFDQEFFSTLFKKAGEKRQGLLKNEMTTAYRLFNGEGDGLGGVTVDIYNQFAVFSWYNASIYCHKELIVTAFLASFPAIEGIYEKNRFEEVGIIDSQHIYGKQAQEPELVKENGVTYSTYLNEGMMTGIFLDQKEVRGRLVEGLAKGKQVLNTFSYTGAFSVAAAVGGAKSTVSVDLAKRSLPKTQEMFQVNHLALENQKIVVMDVFDYFSYAKRKGLLFDLIILDPPSFARNKKRTFSVAQNYGDLVADASQILAENGILIASTNAANLSLDKYQKMVEDALKKQGRAFKLSESHRLPADFALDSTFKEGNYLKVLIYQVK